jgi:MYXO-CTERM domain-containing protein
MMNGLTGEARRAVHLYQDPDLLPAFPIFIGASGEGSPKIADLDGSGKRQIVYGETSGHVHVIGADGQERAGWPVAVERLPLLDPNGPMNPGHDKAPAFVKGGLSPNVRSPIGASVAIGDIDGDQQPEIVAATWYGFVWAWHTDGSVVSGFPVQIERESAALAVDDGHELADGFWASPVLADLDHDGVLDIIEAGMNAKVYAWKGTGQPLAGFPVLVADPNPPGAPQRERIMTTPAVGDLNKDGIPDLVLGTNENYDNIGRLYAVDGRGSNAPGGPFLPGWPIAVASTRFLPMVAQGLPNSPAMADLNHDGVPEIMESGLASTLKVYDASGRNFGHPLINNSAQYGKKSNAKNQVEIMMVSNPAVGDLDDDGTPDLLEGCAGADVALAFASSGQRKDFEHHMAAWDSKTGQYKNGFPRVMEDWQFFSNPAVADVDGDGRVDVIAGSAGYFIHGWNVDGVEAKGFPKFTGGWVMSTPAVGDLDGDGKLELVASTRNGWLYAWRTQGKATGRIDWPSFHHDNRNTGNFNVALDEGHPARPGSCSCSVGAHGGRAPVGVMLIAALLLAVGYALGLRRKRMSR